LASRVLADLAWLEGLDHAGLLGHAADPFVALDAHGMPLCQSRYFRVMPRHLGLGWLLNG
jgi:hypothetical protein